MADQIIGNLIVDTGERTETFYSITRFEATDIIDHMKNNLGCYRVSGDYLLDGSFKLNAVSCHPHFCDLRLNFVPNGNIRAKLQV